MECFLPPTDFIACQTIKIHDLCTRCREKKIRSSSIFVWYLIKLKSREASCVRVAFKPEHLHRSFERFDWTEYQNKFSRTSCLKLSLFAGSLK